MTSYGTCQCREQCLRIERQRRSYTQPGCYNVVLLFAPEGQRKRSKTTFQHNVIINYGQWSKCTELYQSVHLGALKSAGNGQKAQKNISQCAMEYSVL